MKRQLILSAALMGAAIGVWAQKPDTAQILVHYKFTHVRDTNNRANPYTENMVLFVGKNASSYKSYDRQLQNELFKQQVKQQLSNSPDGNIRINRKNMGSGTEYYQFIADKKLVRKEPLLMNSYVIDDALPVIDWHISGDTASFGELHCQKATCHFKGRDYTAWFCPDLPVHVGPWKLNGLPGVIVDAYDSKKEVVFKFDRVEKAVLAAPKAQVAPDQQPGVMMVTLGGDDDTNPDIIQVPAKGIKTTGEEFEKLHAAMVKDPNAFAQSMMANSGMQTNGPKRSINIKIVPQPPVNNPIELPETH